MKNFKLEHLEVSLCLFLEISICFLSCLKVSKEDKANVRKVVDFTPNESWIDGSLPPSPGWKRKPAGNFPHSPGSPFKRPRSLVGGSRSSHPNQSQRKEEEIGGSAGKAREILKQWRQKAQDDGQRIRDDQNPTQMIVSLFSLMRESRGRDSALVSF